MHANLRSRISAVLISVFLAACGGGSGGSGIDTAQSASQTTSPQQSPTPAPVVGGVSETKPAAGSAANEPAAGSNTTNTSTSQADATKARFNHPVGIASDSNGNLYVADSGNYTIRKIASSGVVTTLAGSPGISGDADGTGPAARFGNLKGLAVDAAGNVYVVDSNAIRKITPSGAVSTVAGTPAASGDADGSGAAARFNQPWGIASDAAGNLYVADGGNYLIRKITPAGVVTTYAGRRGMRGTANGMRDAATFLGPQGIAIDPAGSLYVTDWYGPPAPNIPQGSTFIRKIAASGQVSTMAGNFNGEAGPALFLDTFAITADASGNVYLAAGRSVRKVSSSGAASTIAGPTDQFDSLYGIMIGGAGNLFVADTSANAIDKVTPDGSITLVAGKPGEAGSADVP
ncbi:hypothetical protein [Noviherbaspirillum sp.]|uniref:NHL domain-containing protein n=1 Tax=Noviherbaspirillum sp. TaxID=1926288 RepID=UPI002B47B52A|nr:hypothetical protein [Noviherbaspirillum sp.]